ncbi:MAG: D-hexose-6-phosphate mutarotase [Sphaerochaetaceae bacterium]
MNNTTYKHVSSGNVHLELVQGNLPLLTIQNEHATCSLFLYGAHVSSFKPKDASELLFLSPWSRFEKGQPIRGGIPLCFPWFGSHPDRKDLPLHGVVRTQMWELVETTDMPDGSTTVVLKTHDDEATRAVWPYRFSLQLILNISRYLTLSLRVLNTDIYTFHFEEAFHTYLWVEDPASCQVEGLDGLVMLDRLQDDYTSLHEGPVKVYGEFVRVYNNAGSLVTLVDPKKSRRILLKQENLRHVVVWNPGVRAAMENPEVMDSWKSFLCVEHANCLDASVVLHPGETHHSTLKISSIPL